MKIILQFKTMDLVMLESSADPNYQMYEFTKVNAFGITHIIEQYTDCSDTPDYLLGAHHENGTWIHKFRGAGEPIPKGQFTVDNVTFNVELVD